MTNARPQHPAASRLRPRWVLVLVLSVPVAATFFWWIGTRFFESPMNLLEYLEFTALVAAVVTGGYQLYFWVQRNNHRFRTRCFKIGLDDHIPFWPQWIWIYSFLYYLMIGLAAVSLQSLDEGVHLVFGGLVLLSISTLLFYVLPSNIPPDYRDFRVTNLSTRYLRFVGRMDNDRNAFPSMHCAVAAYVGLAFVDLPGVGLWLGYGFIVAITLSCLLVKQHVIVDTVAGLALGWVVFKANDWLGGVLLA